MVQTRIETFPDIPALIDFFEEVPEYDSAMYCHKKMKTNEETSLTVLKEVLPVLEEQEDYTNDPLFETLSAFVKEHGYKNGYVMWPLRTAVSGKQMTPAGATETEQKRSDFWNFPRNFLWDFESGLSSECGQYSF